MNGVRIDHSSIETDFLSHLGLEENNRILFTAAFGAGKSTFLQEVFGKNDDYFTIKLFPVNYSVSPNEDVFELIKFDLLIELLRNYKEDIDLIKEDFSVLLLSQMFVLKELKLTPIIFAILKQCGKIGKSAVDIIEEVKKQYADFNGEMKYDESELIANFLTLIENQKGSENEMDSISTLIKNLVFRIKEKRPNCKSVLIIDDLDRLDPDHTFRLINIFSAHFDKIDNSNKFGFDKVIFVCDFENIRKIFHHKYGPDVDFAGYSDKFFSQVPYEFDNRQYINEKIDGIISGIKFSRNIEWLKKENSFFTTVRAIINSFVGAKEMNLRMLLLCPEFKMVDHYYSNLNYSSGAVMTHNTIESPMIVIFYLLKNFYGSFNTLRLKIKGLVDQLGKENFYSNTNGRSSDALQINKSLITYCLPFLLPEKIFSEEFGTTTKTYFIEKYNCTFHYRGVFNSNHIPKEFIKTTVGNDEKSEIFLLNPYQILLDVFDTCKELDALK